MKETNQKSVRPLKFSILMRSELFGDESIGYDNRMEDAIRASQRVEKNHRKFNPNDNVTFTLITHYA